MLKRTIDPALLIKATQLVDLPKRAAELYAAKRFTDDLGAFTRLSGDKHTPSRLQVAAAGAVLISHETIPYTEFLIAEPDPATPDHPPTLTHVCDICPCTADAFELHLYLDDEALAHRYIDRVMAVFKPLRDAIAVFQKEQTDAAEARRKAIAAKVADRVTKWLDQE